MNKKTKALLIAAALLVVLGLIFFVVSMAINNWDFTKLNTEKFINNTHEISEPFQNISIDADTSDVVFVLSNNKTCKVVCDEREKFAHCVELQNGTLVIRKTDQRKWYEYIGLVLNTPKITVCLPGNEYKSLIVKGTSGNVELPENLTFENIDIDIKTGDVKNRASALQNIKINTTTGNINVENVSAKDVALSVSTGETFVTKLNCNSIKSNVTTGETQITDVLCNNIISNGTTGDIDLKNIIAADKVSLERTTGNITVADSDSSAVDIKTSTGDVSGNFLTEKIYITETQTGNINTPKSSTGGICRITTSTGNINFK